MSEGLLALSTKNYSYGPNGELIFPKLDGAKALELIAELQLRMANLERELERIKLDSHNTQRESNSIAE
jgi:hypothetical protein